MWTGQKHVNEAGVLDSEGKSKGEKECICMQVVAHNSVDE